MFRTLARTADITTTRLLASRFLTFSRSVKLPTDALPAPQHCYLTQCLSRRAFSTTSDEEKLGLVEKRDEGPEILLFQRGEGRNRLPRSGLMFSSLHTLYWMWYGVDFVPAVNASPMADLHIDPLIPVVGFFVASVINSVFLVYPTRLVHTLSWHPSSHELSVTTYSIPLIRPKSTAIRVPVGDLVMDPSSPETKAVFKLDGHMGRYRGHVAAGRVGKWPPYLLDIRQEADVVEPELLLQTLLNPQSLKSKQRSKRRPGSVGSNGAAAGGSSSSRSGSRRKQRKNKRSRR